MLLKSAFFAIWVIETEVAKACMRFASQRTGPQHYELSEVIPMTVREAKRIWRHRQAAIQSQIRSLRKSPARSSPDGGIIRRIISGYLREWERYYQLIHAQDRYRFQA
jgi:hypothetical protein